MTPADRDRLLRLVAEVHHELREHGVTSRERLMQRLTDEVRRVIEQPTSGALAIYVSLAITRSFRLPQPVEPRAVVEPTFATRPLVSALHRIPPHVVLMLHPTCAHLYVAADGALRPVDQLDPFRGSGRIRLPSPGDPGAEDARSDLNESYFRAVDRMLSDYRSKHPSPLVLAGTPQLLDRFCALSRNLARLAGRVRPGVADTALNLAMACTETIEEYLRGRRDDAQGATHPGSSRPTRGWRDRHRGLLARRAVPGTRDAAGRREPHQPRPPRDGGVTAAHSSSDEECARPGR